MALQKCLSFDEVERATLQAPNGCFSFCIVLHSAIGLEGRAEGSTLCPKFFWILYANIM